MVVERVKMNDQGRIVIPAAIRRDLGYEPGDELLLRVDNGALHIQRLVDAVTDVQAVVSRYAGDRSLIDELIAERRQEAAEE
jgi:AbrB family looped-hinge helix DNA binding protein